MKFQFLTFLACFSLGFNAFCDQAPLENKRPFVFTKPAQLDWKNMSFESMNYTRIPIDGGGSIYVLQSPAALKFNVRIIFPQSVFSVPMQDRTSYGAMVDLLLLGGAGAFSYEQIQNFLSENAINIETSLTPNGQLMLSANGLSEDYEATLNLLKDMIFSPRFEPTALSIWKQQSNNSFINLMDANTLEKQMRFIDVQASTSAFGPEHYFSNAIKRMSPAEINKVTYEKIKLLYQKTISKNGIQAWISGGFSVKNVEALNDLMTKIKQQPFVAPSWLPSRTLRTQPPSTISTVVIKKEDMTQSNISLRYYSSLLGQLNPFEEAQFKIINEIFSSSGGVIGNDRFSKKMRTESGLSYSPHTYFVPNVVYPNTNLSGFYLNFQSPNEQLSKAVALAKNTWETFLNQGITQEELDVSRSALMNRLLASEKTVFNKSDELMLQVLKGKIPIANPVEYNLTLLDKIRDVSALNNLLHTLAQEKARAVLVIMGNPDASQIELLKQDKHILIEKIINTSDLVREYE